jgi:uncharacterized linocin/CFP29 family protein
MTTTVNRAGFWTDQVWASIDDGVAKSVTAIRVVEKVFPTVQMPDVNSVPADKFDPEHMSITEGITKPYVELAVEFQLTNGQVNADAAGNTAMALSKLAAKTLALGEDMLLLQGKEAALPKTVRIESGDDTLGSGLVGLARHQVDVHAPKGNAPTNSGAEILAAVSKGIALLTSDQQAPPYALIAGTDAIAAMWGTVINGSPAYTVLTAVLTGGIYGTSAMPSSAALLIALGGDPTTIYSGIDATTEPTHKAGAGRYFFRTFERVQFVARDPRAFIKLEFPYLVHESAPATRGEHAN